MAEMKLSKNECAAVLRNAQRAIQRACDLHKYNGKPLNVQRAYGELCEAIGEGEREHMRFGKRLLGHTPKRAQPHAVRVAYFVQRCVLSDTNQIRSALDAYSARRDYLIGAAIRQVVGVRAIKRELKRSGVSLETLASIDYTDLAGG